MAWTSERVSFLSSPEFKLKFPHATWSAQKLEPVMWIHCAKRPSILPMEPTNNRPNGSGFGQTLGETKGNRNVALGGSDDHCDAHSDGQATNASHSVMGVLGIRQGVLEGLLGGCPFAPSIWRIRWFHKTSIMKVFQPFSTKDCNWNKGLGDCLHISYKKWSLGCQTAVVPSFNSTVVEVAKYVLQRSFFRCD